MGFSYSNTTAATDTVTRTDLDLVSNYGRIIDDPDVARISNRTASLEQPELITYRARRKKKVDTSMSIAHPAPTADAVQYTTRIESVYRTTNADGSVIDEPIAMWLTVEHTSSNTWTNAIIASLLGRLIGADKTGDGATAVWRFEDLMRSALMPSTD